MIKTDDVTKWKFDDSEPSQIAEPDEYPVIGVIGKRGAGKTLFTTSYAVDSYNESIEKIKAYKKGEYKLKEGELPPEPLKIFSNYPLYKIPYIHITYQEVEELPDYLTNGLVLFDEILVGADAYTPFSKSNASIYRFITQMRKRKCTLLYTAQMFTQAAKRIRLQTDYIYQIQSIGVAGFINLQVFKWGGGEPLQQLMNKDLNLRSYYKYYDTNYVVHFDS